MKAELSLEKGEKIEWVGKRCLGSLWLPFLIGFLTLPLYGIGIIFIIYAIAKWLREDYIITNMRIARIRRRYALLYLIGYDVEEIVHERIRGVYTIPRKALTGIYYDLVIENSRKIIFKLREPEIAKKIIEKYRRK